MLLPVIIALVLAASNPKARVRGSEQPQVSTPEKANPQEPATSDPHKNEEAVPTSHSKAQQAPSGQNRESSNPSGQKTNAAPVAPRKRRLRGKRLKSPEGEPRKVVIHHGGTSDPVSEIVPGITLEEANRQRESAEQLLTASDTSLQQLAAHKLNAKQEETVIQIRQYMDAARNALKGNNSDTQRAHTLALKAYLLSDDILKHEK
jgi:hypothetical protein